MQGLESESGPILTLGQMTRSSHGTAFPATPVNNHDGPHRGATRSRVSSSYCTYGTVVRRGRPSPKWQCEIMECKSLARPRCGHGPSLGFGLRILGLELAMRGVWGIQARLRWIEGSRVVNVSLDTKLLFRIALQGCELRRNKIDFSTWARQLSFSAHLASRDGPS